MPWTYHWSSAAAHIVDGGGAGLLDEQGWRELVGAASWKEWLLARDDAAALSSMRLNTRAGRPLATDTLLSKLESRLGRRLRPLSIGRPRRAQEKPCAEEK